MTLNQELKKKEANFKTWDEPWAVKVAGGAKPNKADTDADISERDMGIACCGFHFKRKKISKCSLTTNLTLPQTIKSDSFETLQKKYQRHKHEFRIANQEQKQNKTTKLQLDAT